MGVSKHRRLPSLGEVKSFWKRNGLKTSTIVQYSFWVQRFTKTFETRDMQHAVKSLTAVKVNQFARRYAQKHHIDSACACRSARNALHAWAATLASLGVLTPAWKEPVKRRCQSPLLKEYLEYRRIHRGPSATRERRDLADLSEWLRFLASRGRSVATLRLADVDDYIVLLRKRLSVVTVSSTVSSLRQFIRFLHASGRLRFDLAEAVQSPKRGPAELPRALPWPTVLKILRCIDRTAPTGRRDFAVLLLMSLYGLGAAEIISLTFDDLDWAHETLRIVRPKTGATIQLPFLPAAAQAVATYLRHDRPIDAPTRAVFVRRELPHVAFTSSAIRFMVRKYAHKAGVSAPCLGSHILRHSHASRQIDQHAPPRVLSDILGHRDSQSTSIYTRVAVQRLREVSLPVPE